MRAGFALGLCLSAAAAEAAKLVAAKGSQSEGYGRIVLTFDAPVAVKAKLSGAVLVLGFSEAVTAGPERIAAGMPDYVAAVRRDPDGSAMRLALQKGYRINVQDAAEQVFVDLLPDNWSGFPPPLPPEVVADLARRAAAAEARLKAQTPPPVYRPLELELSHNAVRTRLSLNLPEGSAAAFTPQGSGTRLTLPGAWRIDDRSLRGRFDPKLGRVSVAAEGGEARILAMPAEGVSIATARDGDLLTIDFLTKPIKPAELPAVPAAPVAASPAAAASAQTPEPAASVKPVSSAAPARTVEPTYPKAGSGFVFPFTKRVGAALFERAGIVTLVFATTDPVALPTKGPADLVALGAPVVSDGFTVLRFTKPAGRLVDLFPVAEPDGWELVSGESTMPSESLTAQRRQAQRERLDIAVPLPGVGPAGWLDLDGERIAVVTAEGLPRAGVAKAQRFVDFELIPSRVGLAVLAIADDVTVHPDLDGVIIGREGGMALSGTDNVMAAAASLRPADLPVGAVSRLVIDNDAWERDRRGDVRTELRDALDRVSEASRRERGERHLALAKILMTNGLDAEALGALSTAARDDVVIEGDPLTGLMRGILLTRMGRFQEARPLLTASPLANNPEARLWRGLLDAEAGRWKDARTAFQAAAAVLRRYPDEIVSQFNVVAAETAIELGDWEEASRASSAASRGASDAMRDRIALLRARIDEATGRVTAALATYETLSQQAIWPVAAAATLRASSLGHALSKTAEPDTIDRLEGLQLTWHGGPTEIGTIAALGTLYEEAGRWRKMFSIARRGVALAPDASPIRALRERVQTVFEDLFLGARAEKLGGIEGLALYFDFKEFAPPGRRADEIVRKLADRLVALDLLDSADELLQYQIDHRLSGPARSSVSARLATIRLMANKPLEALATLDATHVPGLPEDLRRARALLRARALSDLSRTDLALETIEGETGTDAERLRADILWASRRWREAGEAHELLLGPVWRAGKPLDEAAQGDVIRAAIAYGLAGEGLGLERLKAKFSGPMAESADARTFAMLTRPDAVRSLAFRDAALKATKAKTLAAFLAEYRKRYPETAVPERGSEAPGTRADVPGAQPPG
nr:MULTISPECIES: hypothetical protein [Methylobacteriaceae]